MELVDWFAFFLVCAKLLMTVIGVCFFISGVDDLFIDLCFIGRSLYRKYFVLPRHAPVTEKHLLAQLEQQIAIMIPAWDESAVIRPMLENTLRSINYKSYTIFVGTYRNDHDTQREVDLVCQKTEQVQKIVTPHDGPTNKADCLNWIFNGIKLHENKTGARYEIFVMQDCEDVIHPLCYKLFNYLIPRKDMVQLPVASLRTKWRQLTGGHYIDEFAQSHYKDMPVREALGASIPAAGVGAAFSRKALDLICAERDGELFSVDSLTEDYEFGFRLHERNLKQAFVRFYVMKIETKKSLFTGKTVQVQRPDMVCVREYFPNKFKFSVRQKSRWVIGITLQGWVNLGWKGKLATRYMLFRDRKAILTNQANLLGYLLVLLVLIMWTIEAAFPNAYRYPSLLEKNSFLWDLLFINGFLFANRVFMRAYCVYKLYDMQQALLSFPRMIWGNFINFLATERAISQYIKFLRTGKFIKWDKTAHHYPTEAELAAFRRKLGDVLIDNRDITMDQLNHALMIQKSKPQRLGEILQELGWLQPQALAQALQRQ
jgi:bacteriophage N4 adsorption protein B